MRHVSFALVIMGLALSSAGCAAEDDADSGSSASNATRATKIGAAAASKRILERAPAGRYNGTASTGDSCSVLVEALDTDYVKVTVQQSSCPECAVVGDSPIEFSVHPEIRGFDMGGSPETPVSKWSDKKDSLSFSVKNDSIRGEYDVAVKLTDLTKAGATLTATVGKKTIQCEKLAAEPEQQGGGVW